MNIDLDDLRRQAEQLRPKASTGVASLVHGVHGRPDLRDVITLESVPLPPIPHQARIGLRLLTLLCVHDDKAAATVQFRPAWKLLTWSWPNLSLLEQQDLRDRDRLDETARRLLSPGPGWQAPSAAAAAEPLRELLDALEDSLGRPWPPDTTTLEGLATLYRRVLPPAAIELTVHFAPDTARWLKPGADAAADESGGSV